MYLVISLFGFEGRIWDLIVSVPDHCLSFYFSIGTGGGKTALPQASMPKIYKQHLYNMIPYTLKI